MVDPAGRREVQLVVNGRECSAAAEPRLLLADFLRHRLGLTGTPVGCEHGVCGAGTGLVDGEPVRSCLLFAVQADGSDVRTVEGLAGVDGALPPGPRAVPEAPRMPGGLLTT